MRCSAPRGLLPDVVKDWGWFTSSYGDPNDERLLDAEAATVCVPPMSTARHARTGPREFLLEVQKKFPGNLTIRLNALVTRIDDRSGHQNRIRRVLPRGKPAVSRIGAASRRCGRGEIRRCRVAR